MGIPIESSPPPGWEREGIDGLLGLFTPGRLSEIVGPRSSGASSLLLALIARITTSGGQVAFVDGMDTLDPMSIVATGADLSALLWVRCGGRLRVAMVTVHGDGPGDDRHPELRMRTPWVTEATEVTVALVTRRGSTTRWPQTQLE